VSERLAAALDALIKVVEREFGFEDGKPSPNFPELTEAREARQQVKALGEVAELVRTAVEHSSAFMSAWEFDPYDWKTDGEKLHKEIWAALERAGYSVTRKW